MGLTTSKAACYLTVKRLCNKYKHMYDHFTFLLNRNLIATDRDKQYEIQKNSRLTAIKMQKSQLTRHLENPEKQAPILRSGHA